MKRIAALALVLALLIPACFAEGIDLAAMTYEQLLDLNHQLVREIMSRPEWKEVRVPAGQWKVGEDIPAGVYSFTKESDISSVLIQVWDKSVNDYSGNGIRLSEVLDRKTDQIGKFELFDGNILHLSDPIIIARPVVLGF